MRITIAERLKPFSHKPGVIFVLPGTTLLCQVFPTRLVIQGKGEVALTLKAPIDDFTVQLDLEHASINVWGHSEAGYFSYRLVALVDGSVRLRVERLQSSRLEVRWSSNGAWRMWQAGLDCASSTVSLERKQEVELGLSSAAASATGVQDRVEERLSLGCHKLQEWCGIARRLQFAEIFPLWMRLGQLTPAQPESTGSGTTHLLHACRSVVAFGKPEAILTDFEMLYRAGFGGMLVPRLSDSDFLGYELPEALPIDSPFSLLTEGAGLIRRLFLAQQGRSVAFLPHLPPEFHCGRLLTQVCDLEWSKKTIRRIVFRCEESGEWHFRFSGGVACFRFRRDRRDPGQQVSVGTPLQLLAGHQYFLDNFQS